MPATRGIHRAAESRRGGQQILGREIRRVGGVGRHRHHIRLAATIRPTLPHIPGAGYAILSGLRHHRSMEGAVDPEKLAARGANPVSGHRQSGRRACQRHGPVDIGHRKHLNAFGSAQVPAVLFVRCIIPMLVDAQARQGRAAVRFIHRARWRAAGLRRFMQVILGAALQAAGSAVAAGHHIGPFGVQEIIRHRINGHRIL